MPVPEISGVMAVTKDDDQCGVCKIKVENSEDGLQCDGMCDLWFHRTCLNMDTSKYKAIRKIADVIQWICVPCIGRLNMLKKTGISPEDGLDLFLMISNLTTLVKELRHDKTITQVNQINNTLNNDNVQTESEVNKCDLVPEMSITHENGHENKVLAKEPITAPRQNSKKAEQTISRTKSMTYAAKVTTKTDGQRNAGMNHDMTNSRERSASLSEIENNLRHVEVISAEENESVNTLEAVNGQEVRVSVSETEDRKNGWVMQRNRRNVRRTNSHSNRSETEKGNGGGQRVTSNPNLNQPRRNNNIIVGSSDNNETLVGEKRAWFHLGKVKSGTTVDTVKNFIQTKFKDDGCVVEKLESKGANESFKVGIDFSRKDEILHSEHWPKNVTLKRFLFKRPFIKPQG